MSSRARVWMDGALVPADQARVDVRSHAVQRGSTVFDVGSVNPTATGGVALFRPNDHIARLLRSAAIVGLDVRWDSTALLEATVETVRACAASSALVRWSAFVPSLESDLVPNPRSRTSVAIAVITPEDIPASDGPLGPARVKVSREVRKAGPDVLPPHAKVAAAYLGPMLAKRRARAEGYDEIVLLDAESRLAEAPTANVFLVKDGAIVTPPAERILPGITRASVLEIAHALGLPVREAHLAIEDLTRVDEAFFTATSLPLRPIASFDGAPARAAPGPVTAILGEALHACRAGADPRFAHWLHPVR
ncbi:MAG TPA: aminotransferase class IV [Polyangiaceae bacterium]|nr:aminotransferase class IV [Polyangiaceae bacterium]